MEKTTIIKFELDDDETVLEFHWNQSLTVNVCEGIKQDRYFNTEVTETDVFSFAEIPSYEEVVESCKEYAETWVSEMLDRKVYA
jgi:hypothetical protein